MVQLGSSEAVGAGEGSEPRIDMMKNVLWEEDASLRAEDEAGSEETSEVLEGIHAQGEEGSDSGVERGSNFRDSAVVRVTWTWQLPEGE